jgi:tetratricopeptide (TPR) repeat protein
MTCAPCKILFGNYYEGLELGDLPSQDNTYTYPGHALTSLRELGRAVDAYRKAMELRREAGKDSLSMEPVAGLARVFLAQGELGQAQGQVEEILDHLETKTLDGTSEPMRVCLTIYEVLSAAEDPRADEILIAAHSQLQEQVAKIGDEGMRPSFLKNVAIHREIVAAYQRLQCRG